MRNHILRAITILAALAVSGLAVAMTVASSMQRAATDHDRTLLAALGVAIALSVHLLPALLRRRYPLVLWPVWLLCLTLAGYGHASWFYRAAESAAEAREAGSATAVAAARERAAIEQALGTIKARPVAQVARQLSLTTDEAKRAALTDELAEARRAAGLRDRLVSVSGFTPGTSQVHLSTPELHTSTVSSTDVTLVMSVVAALLLEVLGALFWSVALAGDDEASDPAQERSEPVRHVVQQVVNVLAPVMSRPVQSGAVEVIDDLADLRAAVARGACRPSVRGIREYMGVGSARAAQIRQQLIDQ